MKEANTGGASGETGLASALEALPEPDWNPEPKPPDPVLGTDCAQPLKSWGVTRRFDFGSERFPRGSLAEKFGGVPLDIAFAAGDQALEVVTQPPRRIAIEDVGAVVAGGSVRAGRREVLPRLGAEDCGRRAWSRGCRPLRRGALRRRRACRMAEYEARGAGDPVAALRLHCWNTEISEAFYGPLQYLEISMRSVMTSHLVSMFGRADWWAHPWIDVTHGARQRINEAAQQIQRIGLPADPQLITEEMSFDFYVSLLGRGNN